MMFRRASVRLYWKYFMMRFPFWQAMTFALLILASQAQADGFGIDATRLIYPEKAHSISVSMRNTLPATPYLVQAAVSASQDTRTPAPFTVTPPLFRLEPQSVNQLRIALNNAALPGDRESIFYLHATAIPSGTAATESQNDNVIYGSTRFGVGSIIKLFYRPTGLKGTSGEAQRGLQFTRVNGGIRVINPSSYFVSFASVSVNGKKVALDKPGDLMLPPKGSHIWSVKTATSAQSKIEWQTINDSGGTDAFNTNIP